MFDPSEYTGQVDCIHAGFPCQDISVAGKQAGVGEGTRSGLYREVLRIASAIRPRFIFLENVAAIKSKGLDQVVKDLAIMGYDTRWMCIRASDVGAPHHRDRWFLLAYANNGRLQGRRASPDACSDVQLGSGVPTDGSQDFGSQKTEILADTECQRLQGQGQYVYAKHPTQSRDRETIESQHGSSSDFWKVEPGVGRVVDGMAHRSHRLKAIGNGQVPLQVAVAFTILAKGLKC